MRGSFLLASAVVSSCAIAAALAAGCSAKQKPTEQFTASASGTGGAASTSSASASGGAGGASTNASSSSGNLFDGGPTGAGGGPKDCAASTKLIYVIGEGNELYSFDPPAKAIQEVGVIDCPQNGGFATPFSMAVDRNGVAWVLFNDGNIYHVDTVTAACTASGFSPNQDPNFQTFGMGFVSDMPGSDQETLYVASYEGWGIAKIDTKTLKLTPVAQYDKLNDPGELTGTGDARLFGFFYQEQDLNAPPIIGEIDKSSGMIKSQAPQMGVSIGSGWAFAFWGGDFYMFTAPNGKSRVDKYSPSTGMTTGYLPGVGDSVIVGAGVSTCAPITPPS